MLQPTSGAKERQILLDFHRASEGHARWAGRRLAMKFVYAYATGRLTWTQVILGMCAEELLRQQMKAYRVHDDHVQLAIDYARSYCNEWRRKNPV